MLTHLLEKGHAKTINLSKLDFKFILYIYFATCFVTINLSKLDFKSRALKNISVFIDYKSIQTGF